MLWVTTNLHNCRREQIFHYSIKSREKIPYVSCWGKQNKLLLTFYKRNLLNRAVSLLWSCWKRVLHRTSSTSMFQCIVRKCWIIPAPSAKKLVTLTSWKHFQQMAFPRCFALYKVCSERETASSSCRTVCSAMLKIFEKNLLDRVFLGN